MFNSILLILSIILTQYPHFLLASATDAVGTSSNVTKEWPCPLAEDIFPCTCSNDINGLKILCDNVVELSEIQRIFSQHFPFPNMGKFKYLHILYFTSTIIILYTQIVLFLLSTTILFGILQSQSIFLKIFSMEKVLGILTST